MPYKGKLNLDPSNIVKSHSDGFIAHTRRERKKKMTQRSYIVFGIAIAAYAAVTLVGKALL